MNKIKKMQIAAIVFMAISVVCGAMHLILGIYGSLTTVMGLVATFTIAIAVAIQIIILVKIRKEKHK